MVKEKIGDLTKGYNAGFIYDFDVVSQFDDKQLKQNSVL